MTLICINPDSLPTPETYTQVVVATGSQWVFVSGQEPEDTHGKLVGRGDLAAQARQVFAVHLPLPAPSLGRSARSQSTLSITSVNTCRLSRRLGQRCSEITNQPTF